MGKARPVDATVTASKELLEILRLTVGVLRAIHFKDAEILAATHGALASPDRGRRRPMLVDRETSREAAVLRVWADDPRFCGPDGEPRVLSITEGPNSFHDLVAAVSPELDPTETLRLLLAGRGVARAGRRRLRRISCFLTCVGGRGFVSRADTLQLMRSSLRVLFSAFLPPSSENRSRVVFARGCRIAPEEIAELQTVYRSIRDAQEDVDRWLESHKVPESDRGTPRWERAVEPVIGNFFDCGIDPTSGLGEEQPSKRRLAAKRGRGASQHRKKLPPLARPADRSAARR